ncbi:hypothetical protein LQ567_04945 [Niabella pedocola]|uniref:Uncharacterized protein n=1 Tax=Niabella pedocola TaxID=1752077 RepID=A0ABS8PLX2_9BACT|nr:hypothetical protein [Niabella pedocola]MCD2422098.1 hypothetical protein [Niabella pedocola]
MSDIIQQFKTTAECDAALSVAAKKQKSLQKKQRTISEQKEQYQETASDILLEIAAREKDIAGYRQRLETELSPKDRDETQDKLVKAEYSLYLLQRRERSYSLPELAVKDFDLSELDHGVTSVAEFIAAVEARKAAI